MGLRVRGFVCRRQPWCLYFRFFFFFFFWSGFLDVLVTFIMIPLPLASDCIGATILACAFHRIIARLGRFLFSDCYYKCMYIRWPLFGSFLGEV